MKKTMLLAATFLLTPSIALADTTEVEADMKRVKTLMHPDYRLENFQHMDDIFPAKSIKDSTKPTHFSKDLASLPDEYEFEGKTNSLEEFLERTETTGLMVLKKGQIKAEEYFQGASSKSNFTSWSVGKTFVSTLISVALKEGHIDSLDDRVSKYVPELEDKAYGKATIKDVLRMATGITFNEDYHDPNADITQWWRHMYSDKKDVYSFIADRPKEEAPGTNFHYLSPNTQILTWVLTKAVGQPLHEYAASSLWQPLGMSGDSFWNTDLQDNELGFCCLNTTVENYAKLGQLYLQQGEWEGQQLLSENWVKEATQRPEDWLKAGNGYEERGYGYHVWVPKNPKNEYFFNGVWGQHVWVNEDADTVIVKTSVDPKFNEHTAEMIEVMRAITAHYDK